MAFNSYDLEPFKAKYLHSEGLKHTWTIAEKKIIIQVWSILTLIQENKTNKGLELILGIEFSLGSCLELPIRSPMRSECKGRRASLR